MFVSHAKHVLIGSIMVIAMVALAACSGSAASAAKPVNVQITLSEFKIDSSLTEFSVGTSYHFVIKNAGTVAHDWEIMPRGDMDVSHALLSVASTELSPGTTITRDYTFTKPGDLEFACHAAGHYEAGMHTSITVK